MTSTDVALLGTFQKYIEDMRALVQCKVCLKPFYEPFTLSCGHTYCYSCLSSWLGGGHNRPRSKNCPDCRAEIRTEPCSNYTLRDMVHMFYNRVELIPEDETVHEHDTGKAEEARILAADRSGRGLFQGVFSRPRFPIGNRPPHLPIADHPIWDEEDRVERCPSCTHELEDGLCNHCGWEDRDFSDDSIGDLTEEMYGSDELDSDGMPRSDVDLDLEAQAIGHLPLDFDMDYYDQESQASEESGPVRPYIPRGYPLTDNYDSEGSDDDPLGEASSEMDDFIEDDEDQDHPDERDADLNREATSTPRRTPYDHESTSPRPYDSDEDSGTTTRRSPGTYDIHYHYEVSSDSQTDDLGYENGHVHQNSRRTASYDIDYDSAPSEDVEQDSTVDDQTNYDSDNSSIQEVPAPPQSSAMSSRGRSRRVVLEDSDDDEVEEEALRSVPPPFSSDDKDDGDDSDASDSEESDDTAIRGPPQISHLRQRRLRQRRANNSHRVARELSAEGQSGYGSYGSRSPSQMGRRRMRSMIDLTQPSRPAMRVH